MQVYDPWNQVLKKVPDLGLLDEKSLMGSGSYTNAALKGGRSYTNAALKGGRSYTNAALKGGRSYTNAALKGGKRCKRTSRLKGGDITDDIAKLSGELGPTLMNSLGEIALQQGEKIENLLKDPEKLMSLAVEYGPAAKDAISSLYSTLSGWWGSKSNPYELAPNENEITPRQELMEYLAYLEKNDRKKYRLMMNKIRRLRSLRN